MPAPERHASGALVRLLEAVVAVGGLLSLLRGPRRAAPALPPGVDAADLAVGYERSDGSARWVVAGLAGLVVTLGLALVGVSSLEAWLTGTPVTVTRPADLLAGLQGGPTPAPPQLEAQSGEDAAAYRATVAQQLHTYRWVDRSAGVVAIPIERAMDLEAAATSATPQASATPVASRLGATYVSDASSGRAEVGQWP